MSSNQYAVYWLYLAISILRNLEKKESMEIELKGHEKGWVRVRIRFGLGLGINSNPNPKPPLFNGPLVQFPLIPSFLDSLKSIWPYSCTKTIQSNLITVLLFFVKILVSIYLNCA